MVGRIHDEETFQSTNIWNGAAPSGGGFGRSNAQPYYGIRLMRHIQRAAIVAGFISKVRAQQQIFEQKKIVAANNTNGQQSAYYIV